MNASSPPSSAASPDDAVPYQMPRPVEPVCALRVEATVRDARGEQHRVGCDVRAVRESYDPRMADDVHSHGLLSGKQLRFETARLRRRPPGEVGAREPGRKAEIVLDPRAHPGLAAERSPLDDDCPQTLGGSVDGGGEPCRTRSHDNHVVERELFGSLQADPLGDLRWIRRDERLGAGDQHDGQPIGAECRLLQQLSGRSFVDLEPLERDLVVVQQVAHELGLPRETMADDTHHVTVAVGHCRMGRSRPPVLEQVVEHRIEPLLRWMPGLHEVVVEADLVDRAHRDLSVRVRRQQDPLRVRCEAGRLREQLDARHSGHTLIGDDERDGVAS